MGNFGYKELLDPSTTDFTSERPEDYRLWSKYRSLKFLDEPYTEYYKEATVAQNQYNVEILINHNLGYEPMFHPFFIDLSGYGVSIPGAGDGIRGVAEHANNNTIRLIVGTGEPAPNAYTVRVGCWVYFDPDNPPEAV